MDEIDQQAVQETVGALKGGIDASAIALFDDDRVRIYASTETPPDAFWNVFDGMTCLQVNWKAWYRELRANRQQKAMCTCDGRHVLYGVVVHERWILLVVARGTQVPGVESVFSSTATVLSRLLPTQRARAGSRGPAGGGPPPAELGIPLWWRLRTEE